MIGLSGAKTGHDFTPISWHFKSLDQVSGYCVFIRIKMANTGRFEINIHLLNFVYLQLILFHRFLLQKPFHEYLETIFGLILIFILFIPNRVKSYLINQLLGMAKSNMSWQLEPPVGKILVGTIILTWNPTRTCPVDTWHWFQVGYDRR